MSFNKIEMRCDRERKPDIPSAAGMSLRTTDITLRSAVEPPQTKNISLLERLLFTKQTPKYILQLRLTENITRNCYKKKIYSKFFKINQNNFF